MTNVCDGGSFGPHQEETLVLDACIETKTAYMDVCDDSDYSQKVKAKHSEAAAAGVPCITTGGIYPGISNIMAAHMISMAKKEYDDDFNFIGNEGADPGGATQSIDAASLVLPPLNPPPSASSPSPHQPPWCSLPESSTRTSQPGQAELAPPS